MYYYLIYILTFSLTCKLEFELGTSVLISSKITISQKFKPKEKSKFYYLIYFFIIRNLTKGSQTIKWKWSLPRCSFAMSSPREVKDWFICQVHGDGQARIPILNYLKPRSRRVSTDRIVVLPLLEFYSLHKSQQKEYMLLPTTTFDLAQSRLVKITGGSQTILLFSTSPLLVEIWLKERIFLH